MENKYWEDNYAAGELTDIEKDKIDAEREEEDIDNLRDR